MIPSIILIALETAHYIASPETFFHKLSDPPHFGIIVCVVLPLCFVATIFTVAIKYENYLNNRLRDAINNGEYWYHWQYSEPKTVLYERRSTSNYVLSGEEIENVKEIYVSHHGLLVNDYVIPFYRFGVRLRTVDIYKGKEPSIYFSIRAYTGAKVPDFLYFAAVPLPDKLDPEETVTSILNKYNKFVQRKPDRKKQCSRYFFILISIALLCFVIFF